MKKIIIVIFTILIICILFFIFNNHNEDKNELYTAERTSSNNGIYDSSDTYDTEDFNEKEISSFSTKLPKDTKARKNNINLACKTINETIIKNDEIFSLWEILGSPTKEKGYKKAKTFTSDGKIKKAYGGGICQVSTTIYNAVLESDNLEVIERHEHSRDVAYIEDGKDASVSYNTADFKFKNNRENSIKIYAKLEDNEVEIKIVEIYKNY